MLHQKVYRPSANWTSQQRFASTRVHTKLRAWPAFRVFFRWVTSLQGGTFDIECKDGSTLRIHADCVFCSNNMKLSTTWRFAVLGSLVWLGAVLLRNHSGAVIMPDLKAPVESTLAFRCGGHTQLVEGLVEHLPRSTVHVAFFVSDLLHSFSIVS
jgi:hypothetical protein